MRMKNVIIFLLHHYLEQKADSTDFTSQESEPTLEYRNQKLPKRAKFALKISMIFVKYVFANIVVSHQLSSRLDYFG